MEDSGEERSPHVQPTVSADKWKAHIRKKLAHGYLLIVSPSRPNANFFKPGVGYETCSYRAAKKLILEGALVEVGLHHLGMIYALAIDSSISERGPLAA